MAVKFDETRRAGELGVRTEANGNSVVVWAFGEIDFASAEQLDVELGRAYSDGASSIALDLSEVKFIDSTGLGVLMRAVTLSSKNGKRFSIRPQLSAAVRRTIEVAGVVQQLPFAA
jgi:anti-anti-sigma factor